MNHKLSLADQAYQIIEEMVVTLKLAPGSVFSESELSNQIKIGRTPLREALQRLAGEKLLVSMPRRGVRVTELNITDHLALLETRRALDRIIVTGAARRISPADVKDLNACSIGIKSAASAGNITEFMRQDRRFDQVLESACGNPYAVRACASLHAHCRRFWYAYRNNGDLHKTAELHAVVMTRVANRDEAGAAETSDQLIDYLEKFVRSVIDDY